MRYILIACLIAALIAAARYVPRLARNYQLLALQRACVNHQPPAGLIALDTHPAAAAKLIQQGTHERMYAHPGHTAPATAPSPAGYVYAPWQKLYAQIAPANARASDALLFLGLLKSPSGNQRLVAVDVCVIRHGSAPRDPEGKFVYLRWTVVRPGSLTRPPAVLAPFDDQFADGLRTGWFRHRSGAGASFDVDHSHTTTLTRLLLRYATRDPADPSHLIIEGENWEVNDAPRLDLWLRDDDSIKVTDTGRRLERRSGL